MLKTQNSLESRSVLKIENCWCRYRDKQMFKLLKHAIRSADHSVTRDIIKKINPNEAELLNDPVFKTRIRFRFGGEEFPPIILFKVYIQTNGKGIKYLCGKKIIKPASMAAEDALNMMGNRKFLDQMLKDVCEEQQHPIKDEFDVSNMKDYMKYISIVDEGNAESGGKGNTWRTLTIEVVPRHHIISDVLLYLQNGVKTENFVNTFQPHGSTSLIVPLTQTQQVHYINFLNKRKHASSPTETSRRSKQAKERVAKMKKIYQHPRDEDHQVDAFRTGEEKLTIPRIIEPSHHVAQPSPNVDQHFPDESSPEIFYTTTTDEGGPFIRTSPLVRKFDINFEEEDWEEEGQMLFEWTQNLSMSNLASR